MLAIGRLVVTAIIFMTLVPLVGCATPPPQQTSDDAEGGTGGDGTY